MKIPKYLVILLLILILSTIFNIYVHFSSPVYKYYKSNFKALNLAFDEHKKQIANQFIPSLNLLITNKLNNISISNLKNSPIIQNSNNQNITINQKIEIKEIKIKDYLKSYVNGKEYLRLNKNIYKIGDYIMGEPLLYFDDFVAKTANFKFVKDLEFEYNNKEKKDKQK